MHFVAVNLTLVQDRRDGTGEARNDCDVTCYNLLQILLSKNWLLCLYHGHYKLISVYRWYRVNEAED